MRIQPEQQYNISMHGKWWQRLQDRIIQKAVDAAPLHTAKDSAKKIEQRNNFDNWVSKPHTNRGVLGATALVTQPVIDYYNHKVDKETRTVARNRTIAKIVAGTAVGMFVVRGPIYTAVENMTNINGKSKFSKTLLPKRFLTEIANNEKFLKNYRSALAMGLALAAMCVTNFVLDAPITIFLTNLLNDKTNKGKEVKKNDKT